MRSEYLELCKTLSVLYSKCERCTDPVRIRRDAQICQCLNFAEKSSDFVQETQPSFGIRFFAMLIF